MAATDATVFPPKNTPFRLAIAFRDNTGALITGWTGAASTLVIDAASPAAGGTPTEVGSSGLGYLDLTAAEMNGQLIEVACTITNANAKAFVGFIYTNGVVQMTAGLPTTSNIWAQADFGDAAGRATTVGQQLAQIWRYLFNGQRVDKNAQTQTLYRDDSVTPLVTGTITVNSSVTSKGKMS
jgi:hypothetical protein